MTQNNNRPISELLNEAHAEMLAQQKPEVMEFRKLSKLNLNALTSDWQGRKLVRLNFEIGELAQTKDQKPMARTALGGIFNHSGSVSVAGKPIAIDGIAGATVRLALPDGTVMDFETLRTKEPLVIQSLQLRHRGSWDQVREASREHKARAPQLVVLGAWADYEKELRKNIEKNGVVIGTAWNFAFVALDWAIVFEGEEHWVAPRVDAVFLDGLETVESTKPVARHAADRFSAFARGADARKAAMKAVMDPAGDMVVENPLTKALDGDKKASPVSDTLDAPQEGKVSDDAAPIAVDDDMA